MQHPPRVIPARVPVNVLQPPATPVGTKPYKETNWRGLALFVTPSGYSTFDEAEAGAHVPPK